MDPYLERHWGDVHTSLVTYARDRLQKLLPRDLRARVEERVVISGWDRPRSLFPDVRVVETERTSKRAAGRAAGVAVDEPLVIELADESETQRFIEIREVSSDSRLVTVLEVLSLSNKRPGNGQEQYLRKQQELRDAGVNLVEIDLLRGGEWVVAVPVDAIELNVRTDYRVVVRRGWRRLQAEYYPIALSDRLPTIKVPLRTTDSDVPLDLQALLEQCYDNGGYDDIDYNQSPEPPLKPAAARWTAQLLRRARRRRPRKPRR
jgi:hypothetical protein